MKYVFTLLALAVGIVGGAAAIVYGEGDDSPGLQGLGVLTVVTLIVLGVRATRQKRRRAAHVKPSTHRMEKDTNMDA